MDGKEIQKIKTVRISMVGLQFQANLAHEADSTPFQSKPEPTGLHFCLMQWQLKFSRGEFLGRMAIFWAKAIFGAKPMAG